MAFVRVAATRGRDACPLCRGELSAEPDEVLACSACGTRVHAGCAREMPGCPTLGCGGEPEPEDTLAALRRSQGLPVEPPGADAERARISRASDPQRLAAEQRRGQAFIVVLLGGPIALMVGLSLAEAPVLVWLGAWLAWLVALAFLLVDRAPWRSAS